MNGVVHIAGVDVRLGRHHLRQRCAWCGAVLLDYDLTRMAVAISDPPTDEQPGPTPWPLGALVNVDGGMKHLVEQAATDDLPETCCASVDPAATT